MAKPTNRPRSAGRWSVADGSSRRPINLAHWQAIWPIIAVVILGSAIGIVYGRSLGAPLIYDDSDSIVHNATIRQLWPLVGTSDHPGPLLPAGDTSTAGRPLVNLSLALNYHFGGLEPAGYHLANITIHAIAAMLVWAVTRRTLRLSYFVGRFEQTADPLSLLVALLWALHPLQTEPITYVTQRTELLMGVCYLATLYGSLRYGGAATPRSRGAWLLLATGACAAGMACKEVMVSAPVVVLLFERTFVTGSFRRALTSSWPLYIGFLFGWLLLLALNISGPRAATAGFGLDVPLHAWWFTQAKVLFMYFSLAAWPWPLVIHYEMAYLDTFGVAWPWLLLVTAQVGITIVLVFRRTAVGFLLASILLILAPTSLVPIATEVAAERRMYLPLVPLVALVVLTGYTLAQRLVRSHAQGVVDNSSRRRPFAITAGCCIVVALAYGAIDVRRLSAYEDTVTLWQDTAVHLPDSILVRMSLGLGLVNAGRPQEAIEQYERILELEPAKRATHLNNLGYALLSAGRLPDAITRFEEAIDAEPDFVEAQNNLGMALVNAGRPQDAIPHLQATLRLKPDYAAGHISLGMALAAAGQRDDAIAEFQRAVAQDPASVDAHLYLAKTYAEMNRFADAAALAKQALTLAQSQGRTDLVAQIKSWLASLPATNSSP